MTGIHHHPSTPLLTAYSAGTLDEAFSLVVASHISLCDTCRVRLDALEAVGGAVLNNTDMKDVDYTVDYEGVLDRIARMPEDRMPEDTAPRPVRHGLFPSALQNYVGGDLAEVKWRRVGMGVRQAILPVSGHGSARLLHIPAGTAVPDHGHHGTELTLVLQGAFRDDKARFATGDIEIATQADQHMPVAETGMDCICLAATDAPLKFNGMIQRIAQKFLRI